VQLEQELRTGALRAVKVIGRDMLIDYSRELFALALLSKIDRLPSILEADGYLN
jgi:hypothetical protein